MKAISQYILVTIISVEFVIITLALAFILVWPDTISPVSSYLGDDADVLKHMALLPTALAIWVFSEARKLLFPDEDKSKVLQKWDDYWKWRIHFNVGIFYALFFAATGLISWIMGAKVSNPIGFVVLVAAVAGAMAVAFSVYMARITLSEILIDCK
jgi:hypothetical protein